MRLVRRGIFLAVLAGLLVVVTTAAAAQPRSEVRRPTTEAVFEASGLLHGEEDFYGFISVAKPFGKTGHQTWEIEWRMWCIAETGDLVPGVQFSCPARARIKGWERQTFTDPVLGKDCTARITNQASALWSVNGMLVSRTKMRLAASAPLAVMAVIPNPPDSSCKGPDEAIDWWDGGPDVSETVPFFGGRAMAATHGFGRYRTGGAQGPAIRGDVASQSSVNVLITSIKYLDPVSSILQGVLDQTLQSLRRLRDQSHAGVPGAGDALTPVIYSGTGGTLSGQGTTASGALFTIRQHVGAGLTPVAITLTAAGRRFLATAGTERIRISLTFAPAHGAAVSVRRVVTLGKPFPAG